MTDGLTVTCLEASNFKGLRDVALSVEGLAWVLLAGRNGSGKSSALDAVAWALLGSAAAPEEIRRIGAAPDSATRVAVTLSNGWSVTRGKTATGKPTLTIRDANGAKHDREPERLLAGIVGAQFLDPVGFAGKSAKDQREALLRAVPVGLDLDANAAETRRLREDRERLAAPIKLAAGALAGVVVPPEPGPAPEEREVSVAELTERLDTLRAERDRNAARRADLDASRRSYADIRRTLDAAEAQARISGESIARVRADSGHADAAEDVELDRQIADLRARFARTKAARHEDEARRVAEHERAKAGAEDGAATSRQALAAAELSGAALRAEVETLRDPDLTAVQEQIRTAEQTNRAVRERAQAHRDGVRAHADALRDRGAKAAAVAALEAQRVALTARIEAGEKARADALTAARMPIEGLSVGDDGLTYRGVPLSQISAGERIRVCVAIAMALSPHIREIMIHDGSLLDEDSLRAVREQAEAAGYRLWVEIVGASVPGAVMFVEGRITEAPAQLGLGVAS